MVGAPQRFPVTIRRIEDPQGERDRAGALHGAPTAVWRRGGDRLTGYGIAAQPEFAGADRLRAAARQWRSLVARADVEGAAPGVDGPVAFGAFTFADDSAARSVLLVPRVVVGERGGRAFRIEVPSLGPAPAARPTGFAGGPGLDEPGYLTAVAAAVERIRTGALAKVVLARDLPVEVPGLDLPAALDRLAERYREAWVFAVDGLFGASPETLVTVEGGALTSRVLAGTAERGDDAVGDAAAREALLGSAKNRFEHALAVDSLLLTLGAAVDDLALGRPFALGLPNVWHLATDATARVRPGLGALDLVALLHPTAAVAGSPRDAATALIRELEPFDRRRYAGPVGWIGADGDGEWAIGLRSAEVEGPDRVRAYAGAGVVAGSDARQELAETGWKLQPVLEALQGAPTLRT